MKKVGEKSLGRQRLSELAIKRNTTHGLSKHPLYNIWRGIKKRCYTRTSSNYPLYGARGVVMCEEWIKDFMYFYNWAIDNGWKKGLQVDKDIIPKKLGIPPLIYSPEMCSIVTCHENNCSRRGNVYTEMDGVVKTAAEWSLISGKHRSEIAKRINRGISGHEAVYGVGSGYRLSK
jgi:hypothetical protein